MEGLMANRHATNPEELEELLLEGILSGEPVQEEITAEAKLPCQGAKDIGTSLDHPPKIVVLAGD
jgi:hypothetical protein